MISSADEARSGVREGLPGGPGSSASAHCEHPADAEDGTHAAENPLDPLLKQIAAIRRSAVHYFEAQKDSTAAAIRRVIAKAIIGATAAIVAVTLLVTCTVMFTGGLAEAIGSAVGRLWIGKLLIGGGVLLATAIVTGVYISKWLRSARAKTMRKYESRYDARRQPLDTEAHRRQDESNRTV